MHKTLIALAFAAFPATSAVAQLIAYEGFDYAPTAPGTDGDLVADGGIEGLNGGTGWAGAWDDFAVSATFGTGSRATGIAGPGDFPANARSAPLSYIDTFGNELVTTGNQARTSFGSRSIANRQLSDSFGEDGETLWMSFLAQSAGSTVPGRWAGISLGPDAQYFGKPNDEANWGIRHSESTGGDVGAIPANEAVFFVARIDYVAGEENIWIWLNPDLGGTLDTADADVFSQETLPVFDTITLAGRWSTDFDEFRLGLDYASVSPIVPAPGVAATLAAAGLLVSRRRR